VRSPAEVSISEGKKSSNALASASKMRQSCWGKETPTEVDAIYLDAMCHVEVVLAPLIIYCCPREYFCAGITPIAGLVFLN
jgi:hypothetical protein